MKVTEDELLPNNPGVAEWNSDCSSDMHKSDFGKIQDKNHQLWIEWLVKADFTKEIDLCSLAKHEFCIQKEEV
jgi:hypothetical protein